MKTKSLMLMYLSTRLYFINLAINLGIKMHLFKFKNFVVFIEFSFSFIRNQN